LTDHGISDKDAHLYAEGLKRGGTLVTVVADESQIEPISQIFKTHGAVDIEKRGATWSAEGWVSFDPYRDHLTPQEMEAAGGEHWRDTVEHHHAVRHYFKPGGDTAAVPDGATNTATHYAEDQLKL
jgi:hypothetical protein